MQIRAIINSIPELVAAPLLELHATSNYIVAPWLDGVVALTEVSSVHTCRIVTCMPCAYLDACLSELIFTGMGKV